jgi:uncharacterized YccA/Bax inhibitor family protein
MQLGRFVGIMFLFLGGFLTAFFDTMYRDGSYIKILIAGPGLLFVGIAMLFFPGGNITLDESKTQQKEAGVFIEEAPKSHKIAWGVALLAGVALAMNWHIFI